MKDAIAILLIWIAGILLLIFVIDTTLYAFSKTGLITWMVPNNDILYKAVCFIYLSTWIEKN